MSGSVNIMEIPALGRPFQLGMLYDATTDKLIQGQELWDKDTIQNAQKDIPYIDTQFNVITDDSLATKSHQLGANSNVKMNLLAGLVNFSGAAEFYDNHKSTRHLIRVSVHFQFFSQKREIDIQQLGSIKDPSKINATRATHIVSGILFGLEAFLIIDRPYSVEEESQIAAIRDKTTACARLLAKMYESGKTDVSVEINQEAAKCCFTICCDLSLPTPSIKDVTSILENHFLKFFKEGTSCSVTVPKKVWLYPLSEMNFSSPLVHMINDGLINQTEKIVADLNDAEVWLNDITRNNTDVCSTIQSFQAQQTQFLSLIRRFRNNLVIQLSDMASNIRKGSIANDQLAKFLKEIKNSPFGSNQLSLLLKDIDKEIKTVSQYLQSLNSVKYVSCDEIDGFSIDFDCIVSFEFRLCEKDMASLDRMVEWLQNNSGSAITQSFASTKKANFWYEDGTKKRKLQIKAKLFKEFAQTNLEKSDTAFVVTVSSGVSSTSEEGAHVILYAEEGPTEFDLPSRPLQLQIKKDTGHEVRLTWSKPKHGSQNVSSYVISYFPTDETIEEQLTVQTEDIAESVVINDLDPEQNYQFTVQAECIAGISPKSETLVRKFKSTKKHNSTAEVKRKKQKALTTPKRPKTGSPQTITNSGREEHQKPVELSLPPSLLFGPSSSNMPSPPGQNPIKTVPQQISQAAAPIVLALPPSRLDSKKAHSQMQGQRSMHKPATQMLQSKNPRDKLTTQASTASQPSSLGPVPLQNNQSSKQNPIHHPSSTDPSQQRKKTDESKMSDSYSQECKSQDVPKHEVKKESVNNFNAEFQATVPASAQLITDEDSSDKLPIMETLQQLRKIEKPTPKNVTYKSIGLEWKKISFGRNKLQYYSVIYYVSDSSDGNLKEKKTDGPEEKIIIDGLNCETGYVFKIQATFSGGIKLESEPTGVIYTKAHLAETIRKKSKLISEKTAKKPAIYELVKTPILVNDVKKLAKYKVGEALDGGTVKVLMVVGATGAGKTTLINGIANYMYGVDWGDDFRFNLVAHEPAKKSQAQSHTSWITAYTLYRGNSSPVPFSLTIIDTPGFGDTEGIERDKKIADQIKEFFSVKHPQGIDVLHGIGFVAQASLARLSHSQKYIFDSILSIYGRDIASNIFLMTTFADGQDPPVMDAIEEANIPHQKYFKFNNSALFVNGKEGTFDAMFWEMGMKSFQSFFSDFGKAEHRSLQLTREVLSEREQLENVLQQLQPQIHTGLTKMDELQRVVIMLEHNKSLIEQNKEFVFAVSVTKQRMVDTPPGVYTTNCLNCNYTCHDNCAYSNHADKKDCSAMDMDGYCTVCPGECVSSKHVNNPYIFELYDEEEVRTSDELKDRYDTAREGESQAETMINNIKDDVNSLEIIVLGLVNKARKSLMRLDEIALKPNPLSEVDYIDLLIQSEEQQCRHGWMERVAAFKTLRKRASLMRKIKDHNQDDVQESLFSWLGEDGASSSYTPQTLGYLRNPTEKKKWYHFWKS